MTDLVSEGYGKPGPLPKVSGKTPQEIKYIKIASKDLRKKIRGLTADIKKKASSMFIEQNAQVKREKEIELESAKKELAEVRDEYRRLIKDIDLERYDDTTGALKEGQEANNAMEDVDTSISVTSVELGNKTVRFVNKHLKDVWGDSKKFYTPELQLLEQERISKVLLNS